MCNIRREKLQERFYIVDTISAHAHFHVSAQAENLFAILWVISARLTGLKFSFVITNIFFKDLFRKPS